MHDARALLNDLASGNCLSMQSLRPHLVNFRCSGLSRVQAGLACQTLPNSGMLCHALMMVQALSGITIGGAHPGSDQFRETQLASGLKNTSRGSG